MQTEEFVCLAGLEMKHEVLGQKSFIHSERSDSTFYSCFAFKNRVLRSAEAKRQTCFQ